MSDHTKIQLGVRNLIQITQRSGDLGAIKHSLNSAQSGSQIHRHLQKQRKPDFKPEVYLSQTVTLNHQKYLIHGRADDLKKGPVPLIDEIKTSDVKFKNLPKSVLKLYWGQVKSYAYLYFHRHLKLAKIVIQLTYVQTPQRVITHRHRTITRAQAKTFFHQVCQEYTSWLELRSKLVKERNVSAQKLSFPFPHFRPGQHAMAAAVYKTILFHKHLFVSAPTGTGKTISTLFPTIKAMGKHLVNRAFYLTAKQSTTQVALGTMKLLIHRGLHIKAIQISAKERIIFPSEQNVDPAHNPYMIGYYDRLKPALIAILKDHDLITSQLIKRYAKQFKLDPFEFSLDTSLFCDVIIGDYNYLFDPEVYLERFFAAKDPKNIFLIDEAHNLVARSRDMYSADLDSRTLRPLIKLLEQNWTRNQKILPSLMSLEKHFKHLATILRDRKEWDFTQTDALPNFTQAVRLVSHKIQQWLPLQKKPDKVLNQVIQFDFACNGYLLMNQLYDQTYRMHLTYESHGNLDVKQVCLDPSEHLAQSLQLGGGAVLFSATLSPFNYYQRVLGNEEDSLAYQLPSPFPTENQRVLITNYIQTTYRQRAANQPAIVKTIHALVTGKTGHYLIFFPSYAYLNQIKTTFHQQFPKIPILVQQQNATPQQLQQFIQRFKKDVTKPLVGFAILGSNFSEGIDLKGDALIGVGIVSVGLPKINPETDLVRDYFDHQNGQGFVYAYQLPGLNKVLQAAGRLIRSARDRGIVALIDNRFSQSRYRQFLPSFWHPDMTNSLNDFQNQVQNFWKNRS